MTVYLRDADNKGHLVAALVDWCPNWPVPWLLYGGQGYNLQRDEARSPPRWEFNPPDSSMVCKHEAGNEIVLVVWYRRVRS